MNDKQESVGFLTEHFDVLKEISNIGSGNAATALASLLNKKVNLGIPKVSFLEFQDISTELGGPENVFVGMLVKLSAQVEGIMMFLLSLDSASYVLEEMMGLEREKGSINFSEMELSAIQEVGNILSSSYLTSLSTMTGLKIDKSIPFVAIDMSAALLSVPAIEFGKIGDRALFIESRLGTEEGDAQRIISGYFILVPELESFNTILNALGVL